MRKAILLFLAIIPLYAEDLKKQLENEKIATEIELEKLKRIKIQEELSKIKNTNDSNQSGKVDKVAYSRDPVKDKIITITDRSILMPEVITLENSGEIIKRINFLNRKNDFPIFLIVDECAGGSALGGELILKAIEHSKAKIYIVVKTYCASMCAIIVSTFADRSYVMNNALILHHEISSSTEGNLSRHKEMVAFLQNLQQKLMTPIAKRRNQTVDQFVESLYKINKSGDATLFATDAVKEQWIINVINAIEDGSFDTLNAKPEQPTLIILGKTKTKKRLPFDIYHMKIKD